MLLQGCPKLPLALGSASIPSAVPRSAQETGGREAASLVQGDSVLPLLGFPPGTTLGDERVPWPPRAPLSSPGCHGPATSAGGLLQPCSPVPTPCKDAAGETLGWEQAASLSWRARGPSVQHRLEPVASSPSWLSIEACGGAADVCPCPLVLVCGCVRPWRECPPLGLTAPCAAGVGACTPAGEGRLQVLN